MSNMWILAQAQGENAPVIGEEPVNDQTTPVTTDAAGDPNSAGTQQAPPKAFGPMQMILIGVMVFVVFMMFRGPKKKQAEHKKMVSSLQKNDRIRTIGGIYGTIVDVRDDEVVLKVDESNNTKIKISSNAIGQRIADEKK